VTTSGEPGPSLIARIKCLAASIPISTSGTLTVVRPGLNSSANGMSLKPETETSSGHEDRDSGSPLGPQELKGPYWLEVQ